MKELVQIQNELKVPKGNFNSFSKFHYRSAEDILEAVKPLLLKHNLILFISDDAVLLGNKIFIKATATVANDEGSLSSCGYAETGEHKGMSSEQTTGTASSYARKYALNGLFLIDETEADADSQPKETRSAVYNSSQPKNEKLSTIERIRNAEKAIRELGGEVESFNPTSKTIEEQKQELDSLSEQYKRLKQSKV